MELPDGFRFSAVACGIRPDRERLDLALVVSDRPSSAAGVFTQNRVAAAPVHVSRTRVPAADARGFVVCAGNANACTGDQGMADARSMTALAAKQIGCSESSILVASTGVIGRPLPMDNVERGIIAAGNSLTAGADAFTSVTQSILTTDTKPKVYVVNREGHRVVGFAKGAAMIGPNMATMLGFLLTDAAVAPEDLQQMLGVVTKSTFNCISVEGHTSTNDSVLMLANGAGPKLREGALNSFMVSVSHVCAQLAEMIADDAEGASHLIIIEVEGLPTFEDARRVAKAIAESALVKSAIYGGDPNWGRVVSAAGYAGVPFNERDLTLHICNTCVYLRGVPQVFDAAGLSRSLKEKRRVWMNLKFTGGGVARCLFRTCDLTPEYVRLNADYTT